MSTFVIPCTVSTVSSRNNASRRKYVRNENYSEKVARPNKRKLKSENDLLFSIAVSTSDYHPRGPGFDLGFNLKLFLERS